jgi:sulfate/thiosulfate transport system permease protein
MDIAKSRQIAAKFEKAGWGRWSIRSVGMLYLVILLIVPILVIVQDGLREGLSGLWYQVTLPAAAHALRLTFWTAAVMTLINTVMGTITAYVMVRYTFPGKNLLNAIIDLPLAIPTLVTGVMLVIMFGPQRALGSWLQSNLGISDYLCTPRNHHGIIIYHLSIHGAICSTSIAGS